MSSSVPEMKLDPIRVKQILLALTNVNNRIASKALNHDVRLVAVSKLKPPSDILALYQEGHRHFGENYFQELEEKAELLPKDIKWHFIGGLQSNKCRALSSKISNLFLVSSVDSTKKATQLNLGRSLLSTNVPLNVHIQVNTSSEDSKSGTIPGTETTALALHILNSCPHLHLLGLMTIGAINRSVAVTCGEASENEDFKVLKQERDRLEEILLNDPNKNDFQSRWGIECHPNLNETMSSENKIKKLELSMGMSNDFEVAIEMGSDEVRVGSTIFGQRPPRGSS
ncbi:Pyridoxal phosphate homeostasis protein [Erysiphe necator]|uniref:Pyridoxal phosphate homeostasis protein n=1 Tax=Uncinula necator TaxID=52586 RepID=A0A0B1P487_UNCNE|nr:Pyridoxal phosphate homeostasis protein [Erysiphe necator]KHJ31479.1 putative alanine racemase family protein [Erysiphe necator]